MFFKRETLLDKQIAVFNAAQIRRGTKDGHFMFWLREFSKKYKGDAYDIEQEDIDDFLIDVGALYNGNHALISAETAVTCLKRFYTARGRSLSLTPRLKKAIIHA